MTLVTLALRWGSTRRPFFRRTTFNVNISFAFQAIEKLFISQIYVLWSFVNFWVIFGDIWVEIFSMD